MYPSDLVVRDFKHLHISSKSHFKPTSKKTHVTKFLASLSRQNSEGPLFVRVKKEKVSGLKQWNPLCLGWWQGMEINQIVPDEGPQAGQPVPLVGRQLPVWTIDDGPNPVQIWKRLCVVSACFIILLVFLLIIKSLHCWDGDRRATAEPDEKIILQSYS